MLNTITILAAMSATSGLMGHGKHCGGGRMHHARAMTVQHSAPVVAACGSGQAYSMPPSAPMTSPQASMMTPTMATPSAPVYPTPSGLVPPAPSIPPAPAVPAAPAPPAPSGG